MLKPFSDRVSGLQPSAIREILKFTADPTVISFAAGNPSPLSFPSEELAEISADIFKNQANVALQYGITEGYPPLRKAIEERMKEKFGIGRDFDTTIVTTGGQQGIELTTKALCNEGDVVICENPSFIGALNSFRALGAKPVGVPLNDDGIDTEILEKTLAETPNARFIYVIPTFHNPMGITSTLENRKKVYELAKKYGVMILEDNPYGELRFAGENVPTYKSFDEDGIVIYCSSFSKILSAGMRIGYVCGPDAVISKMVVAKQVEDVHTNNFFQMLCHRYMTERDIDAHIEKIRGIYRAKAELMLAELDKHMPKCVKYTRPEGGLFLWCTLPNGTDSSEFIKKALANKVAVVPGTAFNCDTEAPSDSFRLNYSMPSDEDIVRGIGILSDIARDMFGE
jgi:2-aminoadipate transaminase